MIARDTVHLVDKGGTDGIADGELHNVDRQETPGGELGLRDRVSLRLPQIVMHTYPQRPIQKQALVNLKPGRS